MLRHVDTLDENAAVVRNLVYGGNEKIDARFGTLTRGLLQEVRFLAPKQKVIRFGLDIVNDFAIEEFEHLHLSLSFVPPEGIRGNAQCNDDLGYFCIHTIFIIDDDGKVLL